MFVHSRALATTRRRAGAFARDRNEKGDGVVKKYTNRALAALYLTGLVLVLAAVILVRYRLDQLVEITV